MLSRYELIYVSRHFASQQQNTLFVSIRLTTMYLFIYLLLRGVLNREI